MGVFALHFLVGTALALGVFVLLSRLSGETRFSLPTAPVLVGLACGVLAHHLSPWATAGVLGLYGATAFIEYRRDRREQAAWRARQVMAPQPKQASPQDADGPP